MINITDVDDKLINESKARGMTMAALAEEMTADYMRNLEAMGIDTIDHFPAGHAAHGRDHRADASADRTRAIAYESDGDVYFDVAKDAEYGKLSHRDVEQHAGRGGRNGRTQTLAGRFRPLEKRQAGRTLVGQPLGQGPARLAHRVLGHEPQDCWAKRSTFTAAGSTWSFRTTKTKSPRANAATASRRPNTGCTTA